MPITSIVTQLNVNQTLAAYRPVAFVVRATRTDGNARPPVVYCDVYVNGVFYKTLARNQYQILNATNSDWFFDIQDACQEVLTSEIGTYGGQNFITASRSIITVFCRFRSSGFDTDGFILPEGTVPQQGTGEVSPVAGTGTQSVTFYVINAVLQHESQQSLTAHMAAFKTGTWNGSTHPLTHRTGNYRVCPQSSDYFSILSVAAPNCVRLHYRLKSSSEYTIVNSCPGSGGGGCTAVRLSGTVNLPNGNVGTPYSYTINLIGTPPFNTSVSNRPSWMNIPSVITGNSFTITGTPTTAGTTIPVNFTITNCGGSVEINDTIDISVTCVNVSLSGAAGLPDAVVGQPYSVTVHLNGTAPIDKIENDVPAWMDITISGNDATFSGTPPTAGNDIPVDVTFTNCESGTAPFVTTINVNQATADLFVSWNRFSSSFTVGLSTPLDADFQIILLFADGFEESPCTGSAISSAQFNGVGDPWIVQAGWTGDSHAPDSTTGVWANANFSSITDINIEGAAHIDGDILTIGSYQVTLHLQQCE